MDHLMNNGKYNHVPQKPKAAAPPTPYPYYWKNGTYDGKELRPYEGRPGAMDAYALPSRGIG